jgi:hypothetical protein
MAIWPPIIPEMSELEYGIRSSGRGHTPTYQTEKNRYRLGIRKVVRKNGEVAPQKCGELETASPPWRLRVPSYGRVTPKNADTTADQQYWTLCCERI